MESLKHVKVPSTDLSAVDLVKDLKEHKGIENVGKMSELCLTS